MSAKYPRTFHVPWSKGATNDDKIAHDISSLINVPLIITEKCDGSNTSLEANGCFARTHSGSPTHASFDGLKALHARVRHLIPTNIQIFGEWCYALHSIAYETLPSYFLMFGIRELHGEHPFWYSWEEMQEWAAELEISTVPLLWEGTVSSEKELKTLTAELTAQPSCFGPTREGLVIRVRDVIDDDCFSKYVMKLVRKDHVQTTEHWKNQEIVKNQLCLHGYNDKCGGGFECYTCGMLNPN